MTQDRIDILLVDDWSENLLALEATLESADLRIVSAESGNEALGLTLDHDFGLILLDVQMPGMDGFETAELLRSRPRTRHIPIIFVTAISKEPRHVFRGYESGAVDYLFKPLDPQVLRSKVRGFVDMHRQRRELEAARRTLEKTVERLTASERRLRESEEKYRLLVENAHDAVVILRGERILFHNRRTEALSGYDGETLREMGFPELIHPEDRARVLERHRGRSAGGAEGIHDFRCVRFDGEERHIQASAVAIQWEEEPAVLCFLRDITRRRQLEDHLRQAQKMEAIGTLAGGIAHDFNNILGVIIGYTEMAVESPESADLVAHNMTQVLKASHRAKDLVQQILAFSHKSGTEKKPIILNPVVKEALKLMRASLPKTIEIRDEVSEELMVMMSNPTQIHQVLMNLCTNAAHAMEDAGGTLEIALEPVADSGSDAQSEVGSALAPLPPGPLLRLSVRDTGHGMSPEIRDKIFEPYFTTKEVGKGTGMGLAVVHGIVKSHEGRIRVTSRPGEGACFDILFPRLMETAKVEADPAERLPQGNQQILLVDDEITLAQLGKQMLEKLGYRVEVQTNPLEALEGFRTAPDRYDLVITDMAMPRMTGEVLARELMRIRPDLPIIICTGYSERMTASRAREMGVRSLLIKPLAVRDLAGAVEAALPASAAE
ncbi:MAG: response regulator [Desulfococcaceae bacterium]